MTRTRRPALLWTAAVAVVLAVAIYGLTRNALTALAAVAAPMPIHALVRARTDPWRRSVSRLEQADFADLATVAAEHGLTLQLPDDATRAEARKAFQSLRAWLAAGAPDRVPAGWAPTARWWRDGSGR